MNTGSLLGQVLGGVFTQAMRRRGMGGAGGLGGLGGGVGGVAMGSVLGGMLGGARRPDAGVPASRGGVRMNRTALLVMLLPLAMRWVQRNGGVGAVLDKFKQQGYGRHAQSWVDTGQNDSLDDKAVQQVVGQDELRQMAQKLGVPEQDVAQAFAEIMPEMVDKLSPGGRVPQEADDVLDEGRQHLEKEIEDVHYREVPSGAHR
ncbi:YidB family protein [Ramlibacter sp. MMS24-I3-19]|uniref:YidB family protein n=1 Tax=Ramlibacter sp. MMS24-I3-19 TaxID=3416606 RepID=UPI003CFBFAB9